MKNLVFLLFLFSVTSCHLSIVKSGDSSSFSCPTDRSLIEFSGGSGTSISPYLICDELDLAELDQKLTDATLYAQFGDKFYKQIANINLKGEVKSFLPLGMIDSPILTGDIMTIIGNVPSSRPFNGSYDGKGFSIVGMKLTNSTPESYLGFFHHIGSSGVVKNLTFSSSVLDLSTACISGTLAGQSQGVIDNIVIQNLNATIDAGAIFGGVVGVLLGSTKITNVRTSGTITGGLNPAYDLGTQTFTVDTSGFAGVIGLAVNTVAGTPLEMTKLTNTIDILAGTNVGGIASVAVGELTATDLRNEGDIESRLEASGVFHILLRGDDLGIPGLTLSINKITNTGTVLVSGTLGDYSNAAGITTGFRGGSGSNLFNSGNVINNHQISGHSAGLIGTVKNVSLSKIASVGNISMAGGQTEYDGVTPNPNGNVGGLIGAIDSGLGDVPISIEDCYVTGHIKGAVNQYDTSAIIADVWDLKSSLIIDRCYVAATFEGGFDGDGNSIIDRGAAIGQIYINDSLTPLLNLSISNLFYSSDLASNMTGALRDVSNPSSCDVVTNAGGTCSIMTSGVLASDLNVQGTFTGFDFTSVWNPPTTSTYPTFK